jgi:hypothetical protein
MTKIPRIKNLAEAVFDLPMKHFRQIGPSKEEFVLILALLFTNSSTNKKYWHFLIKN